MAPVSVRLKRIYDEPEPEDGYRVLVDRIWPRGLSHERAQIDEWLKQVAPSDQLRTWYDHDPALFEEFGRRYRVELAEETRSAAMSHLRDVAGRSTLTVLTSTKAYEISQAAVLVDLLTSREDR